MADEFDDGWMRGLRLGDLEVRRKGGREVAKGERRRKIRGGERVRGEMEVGKE